MANSANEQPIPMTENWDNAPETRGNFALDVEGAAEDDFFYNTMGLDIEDEIYQKLYRQHLIKRLARLQARLAVVRAQKKN